MLVAPPVAAAAVAPVLPFGAQVLPQGDALNSGVRVSPFGPRPPCSPLTKRLRAARRSPSSKSKGSAVHVEWPQRAPAPPAAELRPASAPQPPPQPPKGLELHPAPPLPLVRIGASSAWAWHLPAPPPAAPQASTRSGPTPSDSPSGPSQPGRRARRRRGIDEVLPGARCPNCRGRLAAVRLCPTTGLRHNAPGLTAQQNMRLSACFGAAWQSDDAPPAKLRQLCAAPGLLSLCVVHRGPRREQQVGALYTEAWGRKPVEDLMDELLKGLIFPPNNPPPGTEPPPDPVVLLSRIAALLKDNRREKLRSASGEFARGGLLALLAALLLTMEGPDIDRVLLHRLVVGKYWASSSVSEVWDNYLERHGATRNQSVYRELVAGMRGAVADISADRLAPDAPPDVGSKWAKLTCLLVALSAPIDSRDLHIRVQDNCQKLRAGGVRPGAQLVWAAPLMLSRDPQRCSFATGAAPGCHGADGKGRGAPRGRAPTSPRRRDRPPPLPTAEEAAVPCRARRAAEGTLVIIHGAREGVDLSQVSQYPHLHEVMLAPLTLLRVLSCSGGVCELAVEGSAVPRVPGFQRVCDQAVNAAERISRELEAAAIFQRAAVREQLRTAGPIAADQMQLKINTAYPYLGPPDTVWMRLGTGQLITRVGQPCLGANIFSGYGSDMRRKSQTRRASKFRQEFRAAAKAQEEQDNLEVSMDEFDE
eukprot:TRINITY_DN24027_c0_g1_i1.p1 TRINITY_DN24027_c0_g1~~TRINITY_DN24027_c0_g1_i1.p1  ORF type:complete len:704 (+),score=167.72 TRINITY_DN24027_c0_g1_i1:79-2190(+)